MKIGIVGSGVVGNTLGTKFATLGHEVKMGSRTASNEKAAAWVGSAGSKASQGTFADAAAFGEILFNCTSGAVSLPALEAAGARNLAGKILVDVSNPLDFSKGMPPSLTVCNTDSTGEQLQRAFPDAKVVKALNTLTSALMVNPGALAGEHDLFICGNDDGAKGRVTEILREWLGWKNIVDVGDITAARGLEGLMLLWIRLYGKFQTPHFNWHITR
ncbi:MAG: 8-hydroxy-5-deazaflavin:NADPH oxidoreductase [Myxococcales bacterium]|jgi:predicted dinucleotide-binding enzyme|nr:8-hydroxy-5-deazaflavin:NADPH oxidoreductase [Myxococcales bacterium]